MDRSLFNNIFILRKMSEDENHLFSPRVSKSRVSLSPKTTTTATYFILNLPSSFTREELIRKIT